jgi:hypothetical protein
VKNDRTFSRRVVRVGKRHDLVLAHGSASARGRGRQGRSCGRRRRNESVDLRRLIRSDGAITAGNGMMRHILKPE